MAHHCQSKKKHTHTHTHKNRKNEKNIIQEKNPAKISWPMSAKYDKYFIQKEKKKTNKKQKNPENYHGL